MLILGSRLLQTPVMSLQTGSRLARVSQPIIDPANLKIVAYVVEGPLLADKPSFLRTQDIREVSSVGMIIDDSDELIGLHDVIKIEELYNLGFTLPGTPVIDENKHKLGKVEDYTVEAGGFVIQQLNIRRGAIRSLTDTGLLVHRNQIIEINNDAIVVKSTKKKIAQPTMKSERLEYVNPFRAPNPQSEPEG